MSGGPLFLALLASSHAGDAEVQRVEEEMARLAQRNTWSGVERLYQDLLRRAAGASSTAHLLGAEAARARGDATLLWNRLHRVPPPEEGKARSLQNWETARAELDSLAERFRFVSIQVGPDALPVLICPQLPFAQLERDTIVRAQAELGAHGVFRGLLPVGTYDAGGEPLVVEPGVGWVTVAAGYASTK